MLKKSNEVYSVKKGTDKGFTGLFVANESFSRTRRLTTTRAVIAHTKLVIMLSRDNA